MRTALIGYTGFVGSNLKNQFAFSDLYNSSNFEEMENNSYDLVVCSGISAVKWLANKEPGEDQQNISALQNVLKTVNSKEFILISTIDVYPVTMGKDEDYDCKSIDNHPYGQHRLAFEEFCSENFSNCRIVRLPALFGDRLKKNIIYDLLQDNCLDMINLGSSFQYYYLNNLWNDIQVCRQNHIKLINFFTEPLSSEEIVSTFFNDKQVGTNAVPEGHYDLHTKYASYWNKDGNYIYSKTEVLMQLKEYIDNMNSRKK